MRAQKSHLVKQKMLKLTQLCAQIYHTVKKEPIALSYELKKKEYADFRRKAMKEVDEATKMAKNEKTLE